MTAEANEAPIIGIYGGPGEGKTTLSSLFPSTIHILFEAGLPAGVRVQAVKGLDTLDDIMRAFKWLYESQHDYLTVVIDTLDALEAVIVAHVCRENRWTNIETPSFGKGWVACDPVWRRILNALDHLRRKRGMTAVLVAHSTIERIDDPRAPSFTSYQMRLQRRARGLVMDACDVVGFLSKEIHVVTEERGFGQERARADGGASGIFFSKAGQHSRQRIGTECRLKYSSINPST
jgi:hypothetical protein